METQAPLLEVDNLRVEFNTLEGRIRAVDGISFSVERGEVLGFPLESPLTNRSPLRGSPA